MAKLLIVFGSLEGQTEKIADRIGRELVLLGHHFELATGETAPVGKALEEFDGIVVGSSVHMGHFNGAVRDWVKANAAILCRKCTAFFSVCLGVLEANQKTHEQERKIIQDFLDETDWQPRFTTIFAGALKFSEYGLLKKHLMKAIAKKGGVMTEIDRDYEFTDWHQVEEFAAEFDEMIRPAFEIAQG